MRFAQQMGLYGALFSQALPPGFNPASIGARQILTGAM
jgi:hypothetical protein